MSQCPVDAAIAVTSTQSILTLTLHMTSPLVREEQGSDAQESAEETEGRYVVRASRSLSVPVLCSWYADTV